MTNVLNLGSKHMIWLWQVEGSWQKLELRVMEDTKNKVKPLILHPGMSRQSFLWNFTNPFLYLKLLEVRSFFFHYFTTKAAAQGQNRNIHKKKTHKAMFQQTENIPMSYVCYFSYSHQWKVAFIHYNLFVPLLYVTVKVQVQAYKNTDYITNPLFFFSHYWNPSNLLLPFSMSFCTSAQVIFCGMVSLRNSKWSRVCTAMARSS